ncbi:hypothetical protein BS47DRAFT_1391882 [Hydnum rufescens UP504]|uniref:Uncharacterized protein n=1 Tax=Hydnum rufescens UP504 TaxID=1448309 RepID=A0A9P6B0A3_9AGAM|nr:hypothetical protein BS47DRAFT_1391882 [Hydnum rufescens UP504]
MIHATGAAGDETFKDILSPIDRKGTIICKIALNAFINDVVNLVRVGIAEDSKSRLADDPENQALIHKLAVRDKDLGAWASQPSPLDFGVSTHAALIRLLNFDRTSSLLSLPGPKGKDMTATELATQLYNLAGPGHERRRIIAPFDPKGTAHPVFVIAFERLALLSPSSPKDYTIRILGKAIPKFCIRHIPTTPIPAGRGAPIRRPVWDSWISLGRASDPKRVVPSHTLTLDERFIIASQRGQDAAERNHVDAPWDAKDTVLQDLPLLLTRSTLPKEWHIPSRSSGYVLETYEWVNSHFDLNNNVHRFALIIGFILSKCAPRHTIPPDLPASLFDPLCRRIRPGSKDIAFIQKANSKGHHEQGILLVMWTVLIVALSEKDSPICARFAKNQGLGPEWTKKHGSKGVVPGMLVFVGLAWGTGLQSLSGGLPGTHWGMRSRKDALALYSAFSSMLTADARYGPYDAVALLLGHGNALMLATSQGLNVRNIAFSSAPSSSTTKIPKNNRHSKARAALPVDDDDDDDDADESLHSSKRIRL